LHGQPRPREEAVGMPGTRERRCGLIDEACAGPAGRGSQHPGACCPGARRGAARAAVRGECTVSARAAAVLAGCPRAHQLQCGRGVSPCTGRLCGEGPARRIRSSRRAALPRWDRCCQRSPRRVRPRAATLPLALLYFCVTAAVAATDEMEPAGLLVQWEPRVAPARQVFHTQPQVRWPQRAKPPPRDLVGAVSACYLADLCSLSS